MSSRVRLEEMAARTRVLLEAVPEGTAPYVGIDGDVAAGAVRGSRTPPWTLGFWLGQLHLTQAVTPDPAVRRRLDAEQEQLCELVLDRGPEFDHDLGFLMILGPLADERAARGQGGSLGVGTRYRRPLEAACEALAGRYNERGRFLRAHGWEGSGGEHIDQPGDNDGPAGRFIADTWMNLPLLLWGAREFARPTLAQVALGHARTARELLTGADGWVLHGFEIDPATGERGGPSTIQGASPTSPWSRAQAWTVYGMELSARMLGADGHLPRAEAELWRTEAARLAEQFLAHSLPSGVAPWDFSMPQGDRTVPDTSASAIVLARGLGRQGAGCGDRCARRDGPVRVARCCSAAVVCPGPCRDGPAGRWVLLRPGRPGHRRALRVGRLLLDGGRGPPLRLGGAVRPLTGRTRPRGQGRKSPRTGARGRELRPLVMRGSPDHRIDHARDLVPVLPAATGLSRTRYR